MNCVMISWNSKHSKQIGDQKLLCLLNQKLDEKKNTLGDSCSHFNQNGFLFRNCLTYNINIKFAFFNWNTHKNYNKSNESRVSPCQTLFPERFMDYIVKSKFTTIAFLWKFMNSPSLGCSCCLCSSKFNFIEPGEIPNIHWNTMGSLMKCLKLHTHTLLFLFEHENKTEIQRVNCGV